MTGQTESAMIQAQRHTLIAHITSLKAFHMAKMPTTMPMAFQNNPQLQFRSVNLSRFRWHENVLHPTAHAA